MGRLDRPDEVAGVLISLASSRASLVTGSVRGAGVRSISSLYWAPGSSCSSSAVAHGRTDSRSPVTDSLQPIPANHLQSIGIAASVSV